MLFAMKPGEAVDFLFTGAAIVPGFLAYADEAGLALIAVVAFVVAGAVCSIADPRAPFRELPKR